MKRMAATENRTQDTWLACGPSALPLSYNNWTTTNPHNPLYTLHGQSG